MYNLYNNLRMHSCKEEIPEERLSNLCHRIYWPAFLQWLMEKKEQIIPSSRYGGFEFSYKFWLEPYEKNTAPGLEVILLDIFYYYMLYIICIILSLHVIIYIFIQRNEKRKADSLVSRDNVVLILKINVNRIGCGSLKDKFRLFNLTMICFSLITFLWLLE